LRGAVVPIRPYLGSRVFEPALTKTMGEAFEQLCQLLGLRSQTTDQLTLRLAEAIIEAAEEGAADPDEMTKSALQKLNIDVTPNRRSDSPGQDQP
jgi:hypothetical protein